MKKFMFAAIAALVMVSVSNVFASSKMVSNAQVAPVDTVAPDAPSDTLAVGTPIQPQAGVEDSTRRRMPQRQLQKQLQQRLQQRMLQRQQQRIPPKRLL